MALRYADGESRHFLRSDRSRQSDARNLERIRNAVGQRGEDSADVDRALSRKEPLVASRSDDFLDRRRTLLLGIAYVREPKPFAGQLL